MKLFKEQKVLISGASIAGLSTAYWMNRLGYTVTVVEMAGEPRIAGAAIDFRDGTIDIVKRMGIYEKLKAASLHVDEVVFKNADDITEGSIILRSENSETANSDIEIERDKFMHILFNDLKQNVEFIFNNSITALHETTDAMQVSFKNGVDRTFDLVIGCDGMHSAVRRLWFGVEKEYAHFLGAYFSITIVHKLLVPEKSMHMYNTPGKAMMLNAYNNKTDIIFCFLSDKEIDYDYRDVNQQRNILFEQFNNQSWRTTELLNEVQQANNFYFDKFCQVKMSSWTKGRVALVGDAAYCASPAAGMGGSLCINGAAALADALEKHNGNLELAFKDYNKNLRPFIEKVQATAVFNLNDNFIPRTEEAIHKRNTETKSF